VILSLDVRGWPVLVVGGGRVAIRKAETLVNNGARVSVIAPHILESTVDFDRTLRTFQSGDCAAFKMVYACTDSREVNATVAREAKERGILCNIADAPDESDFHNCATVRRGAIHVGISTGGSSAALAKHLREKIEATIGEEYAQLAEILGARRVEVKSEKNVDARGDAWRAVLGSDVLELLRAGKRSEAEKRVDEILG
jgi:precorrin-2 dehydrogenase/sirohydrochlorin ferrochelatase